MPNHNLSPWIDQLRKIRPVSSLSENHSTNIAVIGAGIAGVTTAYFLLENTDKAVVLVEAGKAAHGATGHNAGQIVSYFEKQISKMVKEYGLEMTVQAQSDIDSSWLLIEQIYANTKIPTPLAQFTGYAGCQDRAEILVHLENIIVCRQAGLQVEPMILADDVDEIKNIPQKYYGLYTRLPQKDIHSLLETTDKRYIAVISARKGCMNSAVFCEDLLEYMFKKHSNRFLLLEDSPVSDVKLMKDSAVLSIRDKEILADKVVLCTNGFENFTITNQAGPDINKHFHHLVNGRVGYMAGYLEEHQRSPVAISYLPLKSKQGNTGKNSDPYFYLTRRTFELPDEDQKFSLICIGGPEAMMDDSNNYKKEHPYPEEAQKVIDDFLHKTYTFAPKGKIHYTYKWHGLMGYTPNGLRCIGPEPINPVLLYNLGCNGVGILPSIYGSKKISQFLLGEKLPPSLFDPQDHRQSRKKKNFTSLLRRLRALFGAA